MRGLFEQLRQRIFGKAATATPPARPVIMSEPEPEPDEIAVPELSVAELQQALLVDPPPLLLDVREPHEWRLVHMPDALHIPMNEVPTRLNELPPDRSVVVICAHGSRSYDVAGYLIEQGYQASSLAGGISQWARQGGEVRVAKTSTS